MTPPSTAQNRSIGLMLGSVLLFAVNTLLIRGLSLQVPAADGWVASLFRGLVGLAVVAFFFGGRGLKPGHLVMRPLVLLRGLIGGFGILAFYITVVHLGAGRAVVINLSYPMFGSLFAALWLKESLGRRSWLWMIAGFIGLMIFLGGDLGRGIGGYDALALLGAVAAGAVIVLIRQLRHTEHTSTIYASQCLYSVLFAGWPAFGPTISLPTGAILMLVGASAVVAAAQLAMTHAYRTLTVARGSSLQMLLPITTALGGFVFFDERFTAAELLGATLTLFATWQVIRIPHPPAHPAPALKSLP